MPIDHTTNTRLPPIRALSSSPPHHHPYPRNYASKSPLYNPPPPPTRPSASASDSKPAASTMVTMDDDNISLSLSDEDMLLCCDDDEDVAWSDASDRHGMEKNGDDDSKNNGRSRRLLSLEQSKVLYKILEKTHFPSTQLREAVASQLGVSPRKVQVWFQNRRQVGKKRMIEAVHSYLNVGPNITNTSPRHHANISLEILSDTLKATGKGRFSPHEDERTRAWRKHTIRLALNPGAMENNNGDNSNTGAGMEDDFEAPLVSATRSFAPPQPRYVGGGEGVGVHRGFYVDQGGSGSRNRALHSMSRSVGSLRIHVPRINNSVGLGMGLNSAKTPTYTGPGSATHLETLTALHRGLPPLTPAAVRSSIVPPAIVSSQKEVFTLPSHHHQQQHQREQQQYEGPGGGVRVRSATLAVPVVGVGNGNGGRNGGGNGNGGEGMREVRGSLTAEWSARQRAYELSTRRQQMDEDQVYHSRSLRGVSSLAHNNAGGGGGRYRSSPPVEHHPHHHHYPHHPHHHPQSQMQPRTPTLVRHSSRERFSPYTHPLPLASTRQSPNQGQSQTQGHTLLRPNFPPFHPCNNGGRSRSVSTPHYPPVIPEPHLVRNERTHVSQLSHSSSSSFGPRDTNGGSATTTPTTPGTSSVSPPGKRCPFFTGTWETCRQNHSSGDVHAPESHDSIPSVLSRDDENLCKRQEETKWCPMDVRSLTTSNIVNTSNEGSTVSTAGAAGGSGRVAPVGSA